MFYMLHLTILAFVGKLSSLDEATLDYFKSGADLNKLQLETEKQKRTLQHRALNQMEIEADITTAKKRKLVLQIQSLELDIAIK